MRAGAAARTLSEQRAGAVITAAIRASVERLNDNEDTARDGRDPEGVHQARVATRRLRSDLRTFRPLLDREWTDDLRTDLRDIAERLGAVRDADVLGDRLSVTVAALAPADQRDAASLLAALRRSRTAARRRMLATLRSPQYARLKEKLRSAAMAPRLAGDAQRAAHEVLPSLALRPWKRLNAGVRGLNANASDDDLHQVRILTKRARYAAEAVADVAPPEVAALAKALASLQDVLGLQHDAVVAAEWIDTTSRATGQGRRVAAAIMDIERAYGDGWRDEWPKRWRAARRARPREWP